jgi:hypothetical protein
MEYNPNLFSMLESGTGTSSANTKDESVLGQCGKFERKTLQAAKKDGQIPLSVFVVASVIEARNKKLLGEAKGLDDVVKVLSLSVSLPLSLSMMMMKEIYVVYMSPCKQILNEITGSLDAKKACRGALQIHEKYLNTVSSFLFIKVLNNI